MAQHAVTPGEPDRPGKRLQPFQLGGHRPWPGAADECRMRSATHLSAGSSQQLPQ
ncbi:hypothetical protein [Streptomyces longisporus]|uniref:hypothetical protein n=1 Tax=Streptomyces longisporus TaxID=1948 RepID=UPI0031D7ACC7